MTTNFVCLNVEGQRLVPMLEEAIRSLDTSGGELLLDFSAVNRVDAAALRVLEQLSVAAHEKGVKVTLRGASVNVYKVLKLTRLGF